MCLLYYQAGSSTQTPSTALITNLHERFSAFDWIDVYIVLICSFLKKMFDDGVLIVLQH